MAINKKKEDRNLLGIFTRIVLILVSTALIVWALPGQTESRLYYEVGRPWIGSALIADFNYDVMRADSTIEREKEEITKDFEPFYVLDEKVEQRAIDDFCNNFTEENVGSLYIYKDQIVRRLHAIYSRPIMSATDYNSIFETDSSAVIKVSKDKELSRMHRINVYSESQAYKTLFFDEELEGHHSQLNKFNLENYIRPNIRYDKVRSEFELEQLLGNVATGIGKRVEQGEKIIDRGEIVTDTIAMKIDSMQKALSSDQAKDNKTIFANVLGQLLYVLMFMTLFTIYLVKNNKNYFNKPRNILMLYAMIIIFPIMVSILARQTFLSVYILPLAMVPMLSQVFLDSHTAFITHVCVTMVSALAINDSFVFITINRLY